MALTWLAGTSVRENVQLAQVIYDTLHDIWLQTYYMKGIPKNVYLSFALHPYMVILVLYIQNGVINEF